MKTRYLMICLLLFPLLTVAQDDVLSFQPVHTQVIDLTLSPLEDQFAAISRSSTGQEQFTDPVLEIFSVETAEVLATLENEPRRAVYSPDGSQLFVSYQNIGSRLLDTTSFEELATAESISVTTDEIVEFSPDSSRVIVNSSTRSIQILSTENLSPLMELESPSGEFITDAVFSPDGSLIALSDFNKTVFLLDAETGEILSEFPSGLDSLHYLYWLSDGNIVAGVIGRAITVLNPESGDTIAFYDLDYVVRAIDAKGDQLLISTSNNEVILWQPTRDELVQTFTFETFRNARYVQFGTSLILAVEDPPIFATSYTNDSIMTAPQAGVTEGNETEMDSSGGGCDPSSLGDSQIGDSIVVKCEASCAAGSVWGTGIYTSDSDICTAASHSGVITLENGGIFQVNIQTGRTSYFGSEKNEVESSDWGSWETSFTFEPVATAITWDMASRDITDDIGTFMPVECEAGGSLGTIWGTNIYTDDSSVCTAAVHMGLITIEEGGRFYLSAVGGLTEYEGSSLNGVDSTAYGEWSGSFVLTASNIDIDWTTSANQLIGVAGTSQIVTCPEAGEAGTLWGTGTYTDDSSICTAAVHMGFATLEAGGQFIVTIQDGMEAYDGSNQNGMESSDWTSAWERSFSVGLWTDVLMNMEADV